jgi:putative membrane protein
MAYVCPMSYGYGGMFFGGIIWIAIIIAVVWLVITLINKNNINNDTLEVLRKRYAKGDISKKQYETLKEDLSR